MWLAEKVWAVTLLSASFTSFECTTDVLALEFKFWPCAITETNTVGNRVACDFFESIS